MSKKSIAFSLFLAALVVFIVSYAFRVEPTGGASAGPDHYNQENFAAGLTSAYEIGGTDGAEVLASSSATTTLTAAQICSGRTILWNPTVNNATATLPTVAQLISQCLLKPGYFLNVEFRSLAATTTFKVVPGTGMTLYHIYEVATSTGPGTTITSSTPTWFRIRITLSSSTDSTASLLETKYLTP